MSGRRPAIHTHSFNNVHTHSRGDSRYSCTRMCVVNLSCRIASLCSATPHHEFKTYSTISSTGGYVGSFEHLAAATCRHVWRRKFIRLPIGTSSESPHRVRT